MTADQIIQLMQSPGNLNRETLPLLKEIVERYPAFETGWYLYLKNLKNLNDSLFEQQLMLGAFILRSLINRRKKTFIWKGRNI